MTKNQKTALHAKEMILDITEVNKSLFAIDKTTEGVVNYVLDTNVLLHDPTSFKNFGKHHVVIPAVVLEELESMKKFMDKKGFNARSFVKELLKIREDYKTRLGQVIHYDREEKGSFIIEMATPQQEKIGAFKREIRDNQVLMTYLETAMAYPERKTVLVTMDGIMVAKADVLVTMMNSIERYKDIVVNAEIYRHDRLVKAVDEIHSGVHYLNVPREYISLFYESKRDGVPIEAFDKFFDGELYFQNDYVLLKEEVHVDEDNAMFGNIKRATAMGRILKENNKLYLKPFKQKVDNIRHLELKNMEQRMLADALYDDDIKLILVRGGAGTGKTLLASSASIDMVENEKDYKFEKMLIARPAIEMGKGIGFLPGDLQEKLEPWLAPIYDNLEFFLKAKNKEDLKRLLNSKNYLEVQALTYIRGRSLPNQIIIIDEAQNLTPHEIKTIITRAGKGTKIIITGDTQQIDSNYLDEINNGLTYTIEKMKGQPSVAVLKLVKTERSDLAELAVQLL